MDAINTFFKMYNKKIYLYVQAVNPLIDIILKILKVAVYKLIYKAVLVLDRILNNTRIILIIKIGNNYY